MRIRPRGRGATAGFWRSRRRHNRISLPRRRSSWLMSRCVRLPRNKPPIPPMCMSGPIPTANQQRVKRPRQSRHPQHQPTSLNSPCLTIRTQLVRSMRKIPRASRRFEKTRPKPVNRNPINRNRIIRCMMNRKPDGIRPLRICEIPANSVIRARAVRAARLMSVNRHATDK